MPEGHTLHRLAHEIDTTFAGRVTRSHSPQGRFAAGAARVDGRRVDHAEAYGKHLFVEFGGDHGGGADETVHVHLGLYGSMAFGHGDDTPPVGAVRWRLAAPGTYADLRGATTCELLLPGEVDAVVARLGPDPLRADADPDDAWRRISATSSSLATLLMDQKVLAGVGNVYRAELLFRHRVDPFMEGRFLRRHEWERMWQDLVGLMAYGYDHGRIDTVRPEHEPDAMGRPPRKDDHGGEVYVYRRTGMPCHVCGTAVRMREVGARNLFWCPRCQSRSRRRVPSRETTV